METKKHMKHTTIEVVGIKPIFTGENEESTKEIIILKPSNP